MKPETQPVHTHGVEDGRGLACNERIVDGRLIGACQPNQKPRPVVTVYRTDANGTPVPGTSNSIDPDTNLPWTVQTALEQQQRWAAQHGITIDFCIIGA